MCSNAPIPACDKKYTQIYSIAQSPTVRTNTLEYTNTELKYTSQDPTPMRAPVSIRTIICAILVTIVLSNGKAQTGPSEEKLLDMRVPSFEIRDETLFGGIARLTEESLPLAFGLNLFLPLTPTTRRFQSRTSV